MAGPLEPRDPGYRGGQYVPGDPALLRVSDQDRHKVAEILREAAGEGRIDLDELDERLEATYAAKTYADLVPITVDLPVEGAAPAQMPAAQMPAAMPRPAAGSLSPAPRYDTSIAIFGGASRKGVWEPGEKHTAFAFCAGIDIDLREARFHQRETVIYANAIWAGIDIIVNEWTNVIVEGVGIMGDFSQARDKVPAQISADSPTVLVKGIALMAGVTVVRKPMPGTAKGILRRRSH